jgi:maspardin
MLTQRYLYIKLYRKYNQYGDRSKAPLILLPGTTGTAAVFYQQLLLLGSLGYHVISVEIPAIYTVTSFCQSFARFLDALSLPKVHLFGCSLGGYLSLHFACFYPSRVESMILCNSFCNNAPFQLSNFQLKVLQYLPDFAIKKYIYDSFPKKSQYPQIIDFIVEQFETLKAEQVATRLIMNCSKHVLREPQKNLKQHTITLIDTNDHIVLPQKMRQELHNLIPNAKQATIKEGEIQSISSHHNVGTVCSLLTTVVNVLFVVRWRFSFLSGS